ncbi:hypothetical protein [Swingsia samuiensis]|uniref:Uncharacterized protein n=1 Tax=Swingsia samuiensis TaxID=1293412 RepID=A0A4Y6UIR0_9PROT|nr:hypothetical protein [Swingsia samuiensis]QDH17442.1 hypothetical protein E3D00_07600 [Swingsia samuiensis]
MSEAVNARSVSSVFAQDKEWQRIKNRVEANKNGLIFSKNIGNVFGIKTYSHNLYEAQNELRAHEAKIAPVVEAPQSGFFHRVMDRVTSFIGFGEVA